MYKFGEREYLTLFGAKTSLTKAERAYLNKVKILKLDDFSVEDLKIYMNELNKEVDRVKLEIDKKINLRKEAEKLFK